MRALRPNSTILPEMYARLARRRRTHDSERLLRVVRGLTPCATDARCRLPPPPLDVCSRIPGRVADSRTRCGSADASRIRFATIRFTSSRTRHVDCVSSAPHSSTVSRSRAFSPRASCESPARAGPPSPHHRPTRHPSPLPHNAYGIHPVRIASPQIVPDPHKAAHATSNPSALTGLSETTHPQAKIDRHLRARRASSTTRIAPMHARKSMPQPPCCGRATLLVPCPQRCTIESRYTPLIYAIAAPDAPGCATAPSQDRTIETCPTEIAQPCCHPTQRLSAHVA